MPGPHVFLIEDNAEQRRLLSLILEDAGCEVVAAESVSRGLADRRLGEAHVVVFHCPSEDEARRFVEDLRSSGTETPCIMLSAWGKYAEPRADDLGVAFVPKPFENDLLVQTVRHAATARRPRLRTASPPPRRTRFPPPRPAQAP
jgi:DNA-binding NtrC family response regulator